MASLVFSGPWCGAITDQSVTIKAVVYKPVNTAHLIVARDAALTANVLDLSPTNSWKGPNYDYRIVSFDVIGLAPDTEYYYRVEFSAGDEASALGRFRTAPAVGSPIGFKFAFASCAKANEGTARPEAYHALASMQDLLFFIHTGDFHYWDYSAASLAKRLHGYDLAFRRPSVIDLFKRMPVIYIWDDHDFLGNNSRGGDPGKAGEAANARDAYALYVPHYSLEAGGSQGIYQRFRIGRVQFLLTDTRFNKRKENAGKTVYGAAQKQWIKNQLTAGKALDLTVWVNSIPWVAPADPQEDDWGGYADERAELGAFIKTNNITNVCMISGDAHMLAIDDGSHSGYAPGGKGGFPVFHAGALESSASMKGGPVYSHGAEPGKRQFGTFEVKYGLGAAAPHVIWQGWMAKKNSGNPPLLTKVLDHQFDAHHTFSGF